MRLINEIITRAHTLTMQSSAQATARPAAPAVTTKLVLLSSAGPELHKAWTMPH